MGRTHDNLNYHGQYDDHGRISDKSPMGTWRGKSDTNSPEDYHRPKVPDGLDGDELEFYRDTPKRMEWDNLGQRRMIERVY